jgi:hypothetical protein
VGRFLAISVCGFLAWRSVIQCSYRGESECQGMGKPRERRETGKQHLFRARLDQIINMRHELVRLAQAIDWLVLEARFGAVYCDGPGMPPLPTRLLAGSPFSSIGSTCRTRRCARLDREPLLPVPVWRGVLPTWLPFDRSSMTRWRQRIGEERNCRALAGKPRGGGEDRSDEAGRHAPRHRRKRDH